MNWYTFWIVILLLCVTVFLSAEDWGRFGTGRRANQLLANPSDESTINLLAKMQIQKSKEVRDVRAEIRWEAAVYGKEAIHTGNMYLIRRNADIIHRYEEIPLTIEHRIYGIDIFLRFRYGVLAAILLTITANAGLFSEEYRRNTWVFLATSKNGGVKLFFAKLIAGTIVSAIAFMLFQGIAAAVICLDLGMGGYQESILGAEGFNACPYNVTVLQYSCMVLSLQLFSIVLFGAIAAAFSAFTKNTLKSLMLSLVFFAINLGITLLMEGSGNEWILLQIAEPFSMLSVYRDVNLMSFPVQRILVLLVLWTATVAILISFAAFSVTPNGSQKNRTEIKRKRKAIIWS